MAFSDTAMMELGITQSTNIHNTRSLTVPSSMSWTSCRPKKPSRWKNISIHTHTHTHKATNCCKTLKYVNL